MVGREADLPLLFSAHGDQPSPGRWLKGAGLHGSGVSDPGYRDDVANLTHLEPAQRAFGLER